jgi:hypothetical protein
VLLDATADLGGMTQLCPWRVPRDVPQARYDRLTVVAEKPYPVRRLDILFKKAQGRRQYTEWMKEVIKRNTEPGQPTLCLQARPDQQRARHCALWDLGDGYQVQVAHWGYGIGSNQWQHCTAVLLFGEFVIPRRVHIADTQGLLDCKSTDSSAPTMTMGAINGRNNMWMPSRLATYCASISRWPSEAMSAISTKMASAKSRSSSAVVTQSGCWSTWGECIRGPSW